MSTMIDVLSGFFAAETAYLAAGGPGKADFAPIAACLDPDVVMYQAESLPYGGLWRGPAGIEAFMTAMSREWLSLQFLEQRFVVDDDTIVVYNRGVLRARETPRQLETSVMQLITVRDSLIVEFRVFYLDTAAVLDTLGDHGETRSRTSRRRSTEPDAPGAAP